MVSTPDSSAGCSDRRSPGDGWPRNDGSARRPSLRQLWWESPVYPLVDTAVFGDGDPGPVLREFGRAGVPVAQLRAKDMPAGEFLGWAAAGVRGAAGSGLRVVVNDRADVALLAGAAGVHLGQDDLSADAARRLLGPEAIIGVSTHTPEELLAALEAPADYLAVGPVFATATKADAAPAVSLAGVREARGRYDGPLVAIGGISASRTAAVLDAGADAVAVISAVAASAPGEAAAKLRVLLAAARRRPGGSHSLPNSLRRAGR